MPLTGRGPLASAGVAALAIAGVSGCRGVSREPVSLGAPYRLVRYGPERLSLNYHDRFQEEKQELLGRINRARATRGAPPLRYEPRAALVGDRFCLEMALSHSTGHWDPHGRAPYLRWGLAGGIDYHVQSIVELSTDAAEPQDGVALSRLLRDGLDLILSGSGPDDGQRRALLDPTLTHVGIGAASVGGQFRMSQEYTRVLFEWVDVPDRPLPVSEKAVLVGRPLPGWRISEVEVRWERPLPEASSSAVHRSGGYGYPELVRRLLPEPSEGGSLPPGRAADFPVAGDGRFAVSFALDQGPGFYFVVALVEPASSRAAAPIEATAAMVVAVP